MRIYGISGLGADRRVFEHLTLNAKLVPIDWIVPKTGESIEEYALRLSEVIDQNEEFGILGVSFGGLVAIEISKILKPSITILVSSVETKGELRPVFKLIGKLGVVKLLPNWFFNPPRMFASYLFGAQNKLLLKQILDDTDLDFAKWATNELLQWKNEQRLTVVLKIGGTRDKLIPPAAGSNTRLVENGEHFMIVDRAKEVSAIINEELVRLKQVV